MGKIIFDTSALLAVFRGEKGSDIIRSHLLGGAISLVNVVEVYTYLFVHHNLTSENAKKLVVASELEIYEFDEHQALLAAEIVRDVKQFGLSLADRACFACAMLYKLPVITCDRAWAKVRGLGVEVILVDRTVLTEA